MRLIFYIFLISQLLNFLNVFAEKEKENSSELNSVKWEKLEKGKSNSSKKIIWKSYNNDEIYFENDSDEGSITNKVDSLSKEKIYESSGHSVKEDTNSESQAEINDLIYHRGITVSNALIPRSGTSQINLNFDSKGNMFGFYGYSLSDIFQLELLNIGTFKELNSGGENNSSVNKKFLNENNFNFRIGGKLSIINPQKEDLYWLALRSSFGKNNNTDRSYLFSELINTFKINNSITLNISYEYFYSGAESFGGIGISSYINLLENLQLIPEINSSIRKDLDFNSTLALRYSFSDHKSLDFYYSNAAGIQDIGKLLKDNKSRFGIKLNFLY